MKLVTVSEMKVIEKEADKKGLNYSQMMQNAGSGLAAWIDQGLAHKGKVLGLVGPGNNGGDTLVALYQLVKRGWAVSAYLTRTRTSEDPLILQLGDENVPIISHEDDVDFSKLEAQLNESQVLIDGILGTGIKLPLKTEIGNILCKIKETASQKEDPLFVVAVDCPSGIDSDNGQTAPECIPANATICMAAIKRGLLEFPAFDYVGSLHVVDIGLTKDHQSYAKISREVIDHVNVREMLPQRKADSHKGTFGTAMIVAGSINFTGAALLAGKAAYRSGVGLVTMAVPAPIHGILAGHFPESTWLLLSNQLGVISEAAAATILRNISRVTAILVGPGWGTEKTTLDFLDSLLKRDVASGRENNIGFISTLQEKKTEIEPLPPMIVDADGLKLLARLPDWPKLLPQKTILTPHPGEMSIISGLSISEIQENRISVAEKFAKEWGHIVVLKGAFTIIADPDGRTAIIPVATSALARAGTGDVLAGVITGLRAQGMKAFEAAYCGAWIHGQAGLKAAEILGNNASVLAGDVVNAIIPVMSEVLD